VFFLVLFLTQRFVFGFNILPSGHFFASIFLPTLIVFTPNIFLPISDVFLTHRFVCGFSILSSGHVLDVMLFFRVVFFFIIFFLEKS
jgi:hypothetical protein